MPNTRTRGNIPTYLQQPFQSEHDRLGVSPTPPGIDERTQVPATQNAPVRSFHGETPVRRAPEPQIRRVNPSDSHRQPVKSLRSKGAFKAEPMPVQVGNHEDQMWFDVDGKSFSDDRQNQPTESYIDNDQYVDAEAMQPRKAPSGSKEQRSTDTSTWIRAYEESSNSSEVREEHLSPPTDDFSLSELNSGDYAVLYRNHLIYSGASELSARKAVESILLQYQPNTDDIVVLKRISIDFGVSFI